MSALDISNKLWIEDFNQQGFYIFESVVDTSLCKDIHNDLIGYLSKERAMWKKKYKEGIIPFPFLYRKTLISEIIRKELIGCIDDLLGSRSKLYLFMASFIESHSSNYAEKPHRDVNFIMPNNPLIVGMLLTLTEFNKDNGGTVFYSNSRYGDNGSLRTAEQVQLNVPIGSIILFDGRMLHNSGFNSTHAARSCLAMGFCNEIVQPRVDFFRLLEKEEIELNDYQKIKLFSNYTPESLKSYAENS